MTLQFSHDDGGRAAAGFKGSAGDCVTRAVAIAAGLPYREVYDALSAGSRAQRVTKRSRRKASARDGVNTNRKWFKDYMVGLGFTWVATMGIGTGCRVHLRAGELPQEGRLVVRCTRHMTAVIDGVIRDTYDPSRGGQRCVYGYWAKGLREGV